MSTKRIEPDRWYNTGPIRMMAEAEGYVMVRRPGSIPFTLTRQEWDRLPLAEEGARLHAEYNAALAQSRT